jgi:cytochrome P450
MEAKIALAAILERFSTIELASDEPWQPRRALHVHGPDTLPLRVHQLRAAAP